MYIAREHIPTTCYASKEPTRRKTLREINSANRGVFEQGNFGRYKPILQFLVMAYENTKVVGGHDWQFFSFIFDIVSYLFNIQLHFFLS
jgi:hypothetical protein